MTRRGQILDMFLEVESIGSSSNMNIEVKKEGSRRIPRLSTWITVNWYVIYWNEENNGKKRIRGCCSECGWGYVKFEMLLRHPSVKKVVGSMSMDFRVEVMAGDISWKVIVIFTVQSLSHVQLFATPWTAACQVSLSITISQSLFKLLSIASGMPSDHFILYCPLLLLHSIFPRIRVISNESVLHIRWPKDWRFSFSISPSNEDSGLISLRIDWFDLLAVQGTFKSLLQSLCMIGLFLSYSFEWSLYFFLTVFFLLSFQNCHDTDILQSPGKLSCAWGVGKLDCIGAWEHGELSTRALETTVSKISMWAQSELQEQQPCLPSTQRLQHENATDQKTLWGHP